MDRIIEGRERQTADKTIDLLPSFPRHVLNSTDALTAVMKEGAQIILEAPSGCPIINDVLRSVIHAYIDPSINTTQVIVVNSSRGMTLKVRDDIFQECEQKRISTHVSVGKTNFRLDTLGWEVGTKLIISSSGRTSSMIKKNSLRYRNLRAVVFNEVDYLACGGFRKDVDEIYRIIGSRCAVILVTHGISQNIQQWIQHRMTKSIGRYTFGQPRDFSKISQQALRLTREQKTDALIKELQERPVKTVVFTISKPLAIELFEAVNKAKLRAEMIHNDHETVEMERIFEMFKRGDFPILITTDAYSRCQDFEGVEAIINYEVHGVKENYMHFLYAIANTPNASVTNFVSTQADMIMLKHIFIEISS